MQGFYNEREMNGINNKNMAAYHNVPKVVIKGTQHLKRWDLINQA